MSNSETLENKAPETTIMVFDSGVGGLSVAHSILQRIPGIRVVYVADDAAFPYGTKPELLLKQRILDVLLPLQKLHSPDLIVVACNTASTLILPDLRAHLAIPVVGVVPAVKPAAQLSQTKCIGLLATPATVNRAYTDQLLRDFATDCQVVRVGTSRLVEISELYLRGETVSREEIRAIITPFFASAQALHRPVDVVVLGCTHFPLLRQLLSEVAPRQVSWIDSGAAIAGRVEQLLGQEDKLPDRCAVVTHLLIFTGNGALTEGFKSHLRQLGIDQFQIQTNFLAYSNLLSI